MLKLNFRACWITLPLDDSANNLILIGKWGLDGSTGQAEYKQKVTGIIFIS